ncbi:DNA internalization-related competence protein ComEC/Rec2 [Maridesulfovibrio hydrothermalis]|uniref:DNA internalization-related competence protein ComEC/Rec2 n=1 Tax=Maridesulfovibrio hydrothermalis AM13 = DSM 14728 TaxID=1121451 RepID=L0REV9_9BACT|nr:DNA internalization-related competence protein ComEC/Rec2 [Maridesulfovibrio hydrothermalis]CCO24747.1 DNA internalization-related competence protein ComEC/Rec2 [Maridesulfovibrio hydrothermalis AM13 = DSM 14728]
MNSLDENAHVIGRSGLPGLLFWQKLLPAFVFGILSIKWLIPSLAAFAVYAFILLALRIEKGTLGLLILIFGLGHFYALYSLPPEAGPMPKWMADREKVEVDAEVHSIKGAPGNRLKILLTDVVCTGSTGRTALKGYLNWTWDKPDQIPFAGQKVNLHVRVKPSSGFRNSGVWDYDFYCRIKNISYRTYTRGPLKKGGLQSYEPDFLQKLRSDLRKHILQNTPPTQGGALFPALLTGDRFFLSHDTVELIRRAGVSHVLALSGLHVGFIVSIGFGLAWLAGFIYPNIYLRLPRMKMGVLLSAPLVLFYLWLGQFTPSLLRAVCMFGFWGILLLMNRGRLLVDGLFLAVLLILAFAPLSVFDLGFQLSVLAVAGIALFYPQFHRLLPAGKNTGIKVVRFFLAVLFVSICANIALLPVLVWNFGVIAPNLFFNILFVPMLGLFIMPVCGAGGLAASFVNSALAQKLFGLGAMCFEWMLSVVNSAKLSGLLPEYASYRPLWEDLLIYYLLLGLVLLLLNGKKQQAGFLVLPLLLLACVRIYGEFGGKAVRMDLLDTGQSQCVVITGPNGSRTVVDGGGGFGKTFDMGASIVGPWLVSGHRPQVDYLFMTHGDHDHAGGLAFLLEKFTIGHFYSNGDIPDGITGQRFQKAFVQNKILPQKLHMGQVIELEPGLVMEVIHPSVDFEGSRNDRSLFLRLIWNGKPLLNISGDLDRKGVRAVLNSGRDLSAQVLILPHHGSAGAFSPALYEKVDPDIALAACGLLNRYNFVAKKVKVELAKKHIKLYTTADEGMISIVWSIDGLFEFVSVNNKKL